MQRFVNNFHATLRIPGSVTIEVGLNCDNNGAILAHMCSSFIALLVDNMTKCF